MKKNILSFILIIFSFIILTGFNFANATGPYNETGSDIGCTGLGPYSTTTGKLCVGASVPGCEPSFLFSPLTGRPCVSVLNTGGGSSASSTAPASATGSINNLFPRELNVGSRGEDVRALQQLLKDLGFLNGAVDGVYGPVTRDAVSSYQTSSNVSATGKANQDTLKGLKLMPWYRVCPIINKVYGVSYPCPTPPPLPPPTPCLYLSQQDHGASSARYCPPGEPSAFRVLSPNGGESWPKGTTQLIKWDARTQTLKCLRESDEVCGGFVPPTYDIEIVSYYPPCTSNVCPMYDIQSHTIATNVSGDSYKWSIPNCTASSPCSSNFEIPPGAYKIYVCQTGTSTCGSSDSYFKIVDGPMFFPTR